MNQQKDFQEEFRNEFKTESGQLNKHEQRFDNIDEKFVVIEERFNGAEKDVELLRTETSLATQTLMDKVDMMNVKLDKNIVTRFELDFHSEKIQYLEKEIFRLKQDTDGIAFYKFD